MPDNKKKQRFTIFLIKQEYEEGKKYLKNLDQCDSQHDIKISGAAESTLYLGKTFPKPPSWYELFPQVVDWNNYRFSSVKGHNVV